MMNDHAGLARIVDGQGWTDATVKELLIGFVESRGLIADLSAYLSDHAMEENGEQDCDSGSCEDCTNEACDCTCHDENEESEEEEP